MFVLSTPAVIVCGECPALPALSEEFAFLGVSYENRLYDALAVGMPAREFEGLGVFARETVIYYVEDAAIYIVNAIHGQNLKEHITENLNPKNLSEIQAILDLDQKMDNL